MDCEFREDELDELRRDDARTEYEDSLIQDYIELYGGQDGDN